MRDKDAVRYAHVRVCLEVPPGLAGSDLFEYVGRRVADFRFSDNRRETAHFEIRDGRGIDPAEPNYHMDEGLRRSRVAAEAVGDYADPPTQGLLFAGGGS